MTGAVKDTIGMFRKNLKCELRKMFWNKKTKNSEDMILEADGSKFGKRNYNKGHPVDFI
ncbi:hypothetical protein GVAV_001149 [Gurleya vavrai]